MSDLDPTRKLKMSRFKTVFGHSLNAGASLFIVDEPKASGEVDTAMARRLFKSGVAVYAEDFRPTPVETKEQEAARLSTSATPAEEANPKGDSAEATLALEIPADLIVWQNDDEELGKTAGQKVTNEDLQVIAQRQGAVIESDDNKVELQRKIIEHRAALAATE